MTSRGEFELLIRMGPDSQLVVLSMNAGALLLVVTT